MDSNEIKKIQELDREIAENNRKYDELTAIDEMKKVREQSIKENSSAKENSATPKKSSRKSSRRISAFAATALTGIVTVAVVVGLSLSVKLVSFYADYTSMEIVLDIENADDKSLAARLSIFDDPIYDMEISAGKGVRLTFDELEPGASYLLEIYSADGDGETHYSQTFSTKSPVTFTENAQEPDKLYFEIDREYTAEYAEVGATLASDSGLDFNSIMFTDAGEGYIDLTALFAGTYYFELWGYKDSSADPEFIFVTERQFEGAPRPVFELTTSAEGLSFRMTEGETGAYELTYIGLEINGIYEQFELTGNPAETQLIPSERLTEGAYTFSVVGERTSGGGVISIIIYSEYFY